MTLKYSHNANLCAMSPRGRVGPEVFRRAFASDAVVRPQHRRGLLWAA